MVLAVAMVLAPAQGAEGGSDPPLGLRISPSATAAELASQVHPAGVSLSVRWSRIEPCNVEAPAQPNCASYQWEGTDAGLREFTSRGLRIDNLRLVDPPEWATGPCERTPPGTPNNERISVCPVDPAAFEDFEDVVRDVVVRYGPDGTSGVEAVSFSLWNEPNKSKNWGGEDNKVQMAREYSDLLSRFSTAALGPGGNPEVVIGGGEIAAGTGGGGGKGRGVGRWARAFTSWSHSTGRDGDFATLNIHAYTELPRQLPQKVLAYSALPGGHPVAVSEFGWALRGPRNHSGWRCVDSEAAQARRLKRAVKAVRTKVPKGRISRLVWFNGVDNVVASKPLIPCPDTDVPEASGGWYQSAGADGPDPMRINTFGLFRRGRDGGLSSPDQATPRCIVAYFKDAQDGSWALRNPFNRRRCTRG